MNVKVIRLKNGEEFVAEILPSEADDVFTFQNPIMFQQVPTEDGRVGIVPMPWSQLTGKNQKLSILLKDRLFEAEPEIKALNFYNSQFGGITAATPAMAKKLLVG